MMFLRLRRGWDEPTRRAPIRQKAVRLAGGVRVTASEGESGKIRRGDVRHMEDRDGKGHHTLVTGYGDFEAAIVQYD